MNVRQPPRRHSLARRAIVRAIEFACVGLGGRVAYRNWFLRRPRLRFREESLAAPGLPASLDGLRIAQLSDLHAGAFLGRGDLARVCDDVQGLRPDLVAITGDFITHGAADLDLVLGDLARLKPRLGAFAIFGNHDYRGRRDAELALALSGVGIRVLRNACARVEVGDATLCVVGVEDLEESKHVDLGAARANVGPEDFELVLCHHPSVAAHVARERCVAVLSGHTHGGQIDLPLLRRAGPAHPGLRVELGPTTLIVSRGLGAIGVPLRFGAPAEVVLVTLHSA